MFQQIYFKYSDLIEYFIHCAIQLLAIYEYKKDDLEDFFAGVNCRLPI